MTKRELAYSRIRDDIFSRALLPGYKLNISELAEKYEMSAIPIREALTLLETENLVTNTPYRGYTVANIVLGDFLEHSLIRNELECLALRFGIAYLTEESLARIKELQRQLEELCQDQAAEHQREYASIHRKFHRALYSFAPCPKLQDMLDDLRDRTYPAQAITLMVPARLEEANAEHRALVESIEAHDTQRATQILFDNHLKTLVSIIEKMKYDLMTPNYMQQELLCEFFSEEQLKNRSSVGGEIEYWNYILNNLTQPRTK